MRDFVLTQHNWTDSIWLHRYTDCNVLLLVCRLLIPSSLIPVHQVFLATFPNKLPKHTLPFYCYNISLTVYFSSHNKIKWIASIGMTPTSVSWFQRNDLINMGQPDVAARMRINFSFVFWVNPRPPLSVKYIKFSPPLRSSCSSCQKKYSWPKISKGLQDGVKTENSVIFSFI